VGGQLRSAAEDHHQDRVPVPQGDERRQKAHRGDASTAKSGNPDADKGGGIYRDGTGSATPM